MRRGGLETPLAEARGKRETGPPDPPRAVLTNRSASSEYLGVSLLPDAVIRVCVTVDITHEPLPVQPAHGGCQRQAIVQRFSRGTD